MKKLNTTLQEVSSVVGGTIEDKFAFFKIDDITCLKYATSSSLSFFNGSFVYKEDLNNTKCGACFVTEKLAHKLPKHVIPVIVTDPYLAIAQAITKYIGSGEVLPTKFISKYPEGISPMATVSACAKIGKNVTIMPNVYIGANVIIEDGVTIKSGACLEHCTIGEGSFVDSGAKIGSAGFGFVPAANGQHYPVPQIARVVIGKNVSIGANTCIDRGFLTDTKIGENTKIDNLCHIAHGVEIGTGCFIAGAACFAGSVKVGNFVMVGGNTAITGHIEIADFVKITGLSGVTSSILTKGVTFSGTPAVENTLWKKMHIHLKKLVSKR